MKSYGISMNQEMVLLTVLTVVVLLQKLLQQHQKYLGMFTQMM